MNAQSASDQPLPEQGRESCPINGLRYEPEWVGTNIHLLSQPVTDAASELFDVELPVIAKASTLRRATFSSGRRCARALLSSNGLPSQALPRHDDGSVQWPEGVIGSLSHTNDWAVAAVAFTSMSEARQLGIDLERIQELEHGVLDLITTAAEREEIASASATPWLGTAVFSLKESIYKCLARDFGQFIEFKDVQLNAMRSGRPRIEFLQPELRARYAPDQLELRLAVTPWHVFSMAWLRSD